MTLTDEELVQRAADVAMGVASPSWVVSPSELSLLRAIAETRSEARRHELARQAQERAGQMTQLGLELLRVVFAVAIA